MQMLGGRGGGGGDYDQSPPPESGRGRPAGNAGGAPGPGGFDNMDDDIPF